MWGERRIEFTVMQEVKNQASHRTQILELEHNALSLGLYPPHLNTSLSKMVTGGVCVCFCFFFSFPLYLKEYYCIYTLTSIFSTLCELKKFLESMECVNTMQISGKASLNIRSNPTWSLKLVNFELQQLV